MDPVLIVVSAVKALIVWFIVMLVGTNLAGLVGRGIWEGSSAAYNGPIDKEAKRFNNIINVFSVFLAVMLLVAVYKYLGIIFLIALLLTMISRAPDLYWEIRVLPKKLNLPYPLPRDVINRELAKEIKKQKSFQDYIIASLTWIALIIIFVSLL